MVVIVDASWCRVLHQFYQASADVSPLLSYAYLD